MNTELTSIDEKFYLPIKESFISMTNEKVFKREINFAAQLIKKSQALQKCSVESVLEAVMNISQTNLTLNPVLKYAYLIPRKGKCILEPGYQGLIKLATDTDNIVSINVQLVYEGCEAEIDLATEKKIIKHIPYMVNGNDKGMIVYGYSIAMLQDGSRHVELMSIKQILDVRECSESYKYFKNKKAKGEWASCVWDSDAPEMSRKTIVKRHFKYLPKSDNKQLEKAIELDNKDYDFPVTSQQLDFIDSLLIYALITEQEKNKVDEDMASGMTQKEAGTIINFLLANQADPISSGNNYKAGDVTSKLENEA